MSEPLSRQELLEKVVSGLRAQGKKSVRAGCGTYYGTYGANCMYRGPDGAKCGIGLLMPDEVYETSFDDNGGCGLVANALPDHVLEACGFDLSREFEKEFAGALQKIHDDLNPEDWEDARNINPVVARYGVAL